MRSIARSRPRNGGESRRIIGRPLTADFSGKGLLFFGGIALLASSIAVIRLRVRNRMMGQVLEFGLIATAVYLFFQTMQ